MRIKSDVTGGYLNIKIKTAFNERIDINELKRFENADMIGFLQPDVVVTDRKVHYVGEKGVSLYEYLQSERSFQEFYTLLINILDIFETVQMKHFSIRNISMNLENVYINEVTEKLQFLYIPLTGSVTEENIRSFFLKIMNMCLAKDERKRKLIADLSDFINSNDIFTVKELKRFLQKSVFTKRSDAECTLVSQKNPESAEPLCIPVYIDRSTRKNSQNNEENIGLLRDINTNQVYEIKKNVFSIGKERESSDCFLASNPFVSRHHAKIFRHDGKFYLQDMNSANHTFVNGRKITALKEQEIVNGDLVEFSNEKMIFECRNFRSVKQEQSDSKKETNE